MQTRHAIALIVAGLLTLALTGCATTGNGFLARQWSGTIRQLDINPLFPPREDVYVGDVYLPPVPPHSTNDTTFLKKSGYVPLGSLFAYTNLTTQVVNFYRDRPAFAPTSKSTADAIASIDQSPSTIIPMPRDVPRNTNPSSKGGTFGEYDLGRLREVGFPSFFSFSISKGNLSAIVPVEAFPVFFGAAFGGKKVVKISVPVAESYGVPESVILSYLVSKQEECKSVAPCLKASALGITNLGPQNFHLFIPKGQGGPDAKVAYVTIISEVYYTRAIDVSLAIGRASGGTIKIAVPSSSSKSVTPSVSQNERESEASQAARKTLVSNETDKNPAGNSGNARDSDSAGSKPAPENPVQKTPRFCGEGQTSLGDVQKALGAASSRSAPGGSLTVLSCSDNTISLRRTYQEPIAIGYRGLTLKVNPKNLGILGGSPTNTVQPQNLGE